MKGKNNSQKGHKGGMSKVMLGAGVLTGAAIGTGVAIGLSNSKTRRMIGQRMNEMKDMALVAIEEAQHQSTSVQKHPMTKKMLKMAKTTKKRAN